MTLAGLIGSPASAVDPVIHWNFDGDFSNSGTGGSAYDAILVDGASGTHGFTAGVFGQALDFGHSSPANGSAAGNMADGDYVSVDYTLPSAGTIAMWYYVDPYYDYQTLFDVVGTDTSVDPPVPYSANDWEMWIYANGVIRGRQKNVDNLLYSVDADLNANGGAGNWIHVAYTWDKTDTSDTGQKLFVNGQLASAKPTAWVDPPATFTLAGGNEGNTYGVGAFDDVRIYDQRLTGDEIRSLPGVTTDAMPEPVVYLPLDGDVTNHGTGGAAYDGYLISGANGSATYVPGVNGEGQALDFDYTGSSNSDGAFIAIPYTLPDNGAISVYYKPQSFYNYNSVWDNSVNPDDWEMWIYGNTLIRARIDGGQGQTDFDINRNDADPDDDYATADDWLLLTYTWRKPTADGPGYATLYVDGRLAMTDAIDSEATWIVPGEEFYLAGGNNGNMYGTGVFDELMIFDQYLTSAQVAALYGISEENHGGTVVTMPGDLNGDGSVNSADLDMVRGNWGNAVTPNTMGDANGDGFVNSADLDIVRSNWGATTGAAVPEPGTMLLFVVGAFLVAARRKRR